jgi:hypothetical protein
MRETLRKLSDEYVAVLSDCYMEDSVSCELADRLKNINDQWDKKFENLIYITCEIESKCEIVDREIDRLTDKLVRYHKNLKSIKEYMKNEMLSTGKTKFETPFHTVSLRTSEKTDIDDEFVNYAVKNQLNQFIRVIPERIEPDKTAIKEHIKAGNKLKLRYAQIIENQNLSIR